jgi:hypothetical protein
MKMRHLEVYCLLAQQIRQTGFEPQEAACNPGADIPEGCFSIRRMTVTGRMLPIIEK